MSAINPVSPASVLRTAALNGDMVTVRQLVLEGVDVNIWNKHGYTALTYASSKGHLDIVEFLIVNGAWVDPHEDYDTYDTPLMLAVTHGHFGVVKKLVEAGANPTWHVGTAQMTAENYARIEAQKEIHEYLLKAIEKLEGK